MVDRLRRLRGKGDGRQRPDMLHGPEGVRQAGHRRYVGGLWDEIGRLQFDFLVAEGLLSHHYLLDIACGSLRAGVHFIPYLESGHYLGIEKEADLLQAGIDQELGRELYEQKRPVLLADGAFSFERFGVRPDFALAQSLFTHLPVEIIEQCMRKLRPVIADTGRFYATFFETHEQWTNPDEPHDHGTFKFTRQQFNELGRATGWDAHYIGEWKHPRGQVMVLYKPAGGA
jgi:hypothetical protein